MSSRDASSRSWLRGLTPHYAFYFVVLGVPFVIGVLVSLSPTLLIVAILTVAPIWLVVALVMLIWAIASLIRRDLGGALWRGAIFAAMLVSPWPLMDVGQYSGWQAHLLIGLPYYEAQINKLPVAKDDRVKMFYWGSYLIFNDNYLAYDESDQLKLPEPEERPSFRARVAAQIVDPHWDTWAHLWGHYYVVDGHG
ncbi:MAG: hypothetical protein ACREEB_04650 [Caulobacteraceae bacterium]